MHSIMHYGAILPIDTILKELALHMAPLIICHIWNFAPGFDEQSANSHTSCHCVTGKIILGILHDTFCA